MREHDEVTAEIRRLMYVRDELKPDNQTDNDAIDAMIRVLATDMNVSDIELMYQTAYSKVCARHALDWKRGVPWADSPSIDWSEAHEAHPNVAH